MVVDYYSSGGHYEICFSLLSAFSLVPVTFSMPCLSLCCRPCFRPRLSLIVLCLLSAPLLSSCFCSCPCAVLLSLCCAVLPISIEIGHVTAVEQRNDEIKENSSMLGVNSSCSLRFLAPSTLNDYCLRFVIMITIKRQWFAQRTPVGVAPRSSSCAVARVGRASGGPKPRFDVWVRMMLVGEGRTWLMQGSTLPKKLLSEIWKMQMQTSREAWE